MDNSTALYFIVKKKTQLRILSVLCLGLCVQSGRKESPSVHKVISGSQVTRHRASYSAVLKAGDESGALDEDLMRLGHVRWLL